MSNRCIGINKYNKKCRTITKGDNLFCCDSHKPINYDIIETGCFICSEKITKYYELIYFKCKHAFHKDCYTEWLNFSTYENKICLICRKEQNTNNTINHMYKTIDDDLVKKKLINTYNLLKN